MGVTGQAIGRQRSASDAGGATVLVTEADRKQALAVIRALGKRGYEVIAASHTPTAQGFFSKHATETVVYENLRSDEPAFADDLLEAVERYDVDVLLPTEHFTTISVARIRDRLPSRVSVPFVEYDTLLDAEDKERLLSIADDVGIPIPATYRPTSLAELDEIASDVDYPAVIKYTQATGAIGVRYVHSPEELRATYRPDEESVRNVESDWPLVQEYVPGQTHDVDTLFVDGEPRATFTARRTSTYPRSGGRSVIAESTDEPELVEFATRLLEHLDWHGVAEVEFKMDERDGRPKLIEVNPRIWGKIDVAIRAGVDFPTMLCELALTGDVTPPESYAVGEKIIWLDEGLALNLWRSPDRFDYLQYVAREYASGADTTVERGDVAPHVVRALQLGWRAAPTNVTDGLGSIAARVGGLARAGNS